MIRSGKPRGGVATGMVLLLLAVGALTACGGGGSGGGSEVSPIATPREQPLLLTAANAVQATAESFGFAGVALGLGQLAVDWAATSDGAAGAVVTSPCATGGTLTVALSDRDGNHHVSAGDQITVTVVNCYLKPLEENFTGALTIEFTAPAASQQQAGTISFGGQFDVVTGGATIRLGGSLRYDYSVDRLTRSIHVTSTAQSLTIAGTSSTNTVTEVVTQLDATRSVRRDTARAMATLRYHLASDVLGGAIDVATTTAWSAWFDSFPDAGELTVTGNAGQLAQLRASASGGAAFDVVFARASVGSVGAGEAVTPYLWSGTGWYEGAGNALGYNPQQASGIGFKALGQPTLITLQPNPGALTWWYSRPLAAGTVSAATFVLTAVPPGRSVQYLEVPATLTIEGALLSVTPMTQLEPGASYVVVFDNNDYGQITNISGESLARPTYQGTVAQTISASAKLGGLALLLGSSETLALDASGSIAPGSAIVATHWTQLSGPTLTFSGADTPIATVSAPLSSGNGSAVVEVEVSNIAGDVDRARLTFQVLPDMTHTMVIGYRVGNLPMTIESLTDLNGSTPRYFPAYNVLDALINSRLLSSLPSGTAWQTGLDINYGTGGMPGVVVDWSTPGVVCTSPSGHLKVLDYAIDPVGAITRLAIDFEDICDSVTTYGSIRFGTSLALRQ